MRHNCSKSDESTSSSSLDTLDGLFGDLNMIGVVRQNWSESNKSGSAVCLVSSTCCLLDKLDRERTFIQNSLLLDNFLKQSSKSTSSLSADTLDKGTLLVTFVKRRFSAA